MSATERPARALRVWNGVILTFPASFQMSLYVRRGIPPHHRRQLTPDGRCWWISWVAAGPVLTEARTACGGVLVAGGAR